MLWNVIDLVWNKKKLQISGRIHVALHPKASSESQNINTNTVHAVQSTWRPSGEVKYRFYQTFDRLCGEEMFRLLWLHKAQASKRDTGVFAAGNVAPYCSCTSNFKHLYRGIATCVDALRLSNLGVHDLLGKVYISNWTHGHCSLWWHHVDRLHFVQVWMCLITWAQFCAKIHVPQMF